MTFPLPAFGYFAYPAVVARDYLVSRMPGEYVITTLIPSAPRPAKLIVVRTVPGGRMGGSMPILSNRRLIVWTYDVSETVAGQVAEYAAGYLYEAMYQYGSGIRQTVINVPPYYFPDPDDPAKTPRFQFTADILLRAKTGGSPGGLTPPPGPTNSSGIPSGYTWVVGEVLSDQVDGETSVFETAYQYYPGVIMVYVNGIREIYVTEMTSDTIELGYIPPEGTLITVDYLTNEGGS